jgi:hypothetical protein
VNSFIKEQDISCQLWLSFQKGKRGGRPGRSSPYNDNIHNITSGT